MVSFVHPLFLLLVAAVAVPIVVHLTRRDTAARTTFPATSLLLGSAEVVRRRRSFIERLLLALRVLAIVAAVAAFARPRVPPVSAAAAGKRLAAVAIVLDDTPSMGALWREASDRTAGRATRMAEAVRAVGLVLDRLEHGSPVRLQTATRLVLDAAIDPAQVRAALAGVTPSDEAPSLAGALADSAAWLARDDLPPDRALYVVSDFQAHTWRDASRSWIGLAYPVRALDLARVGADDWGVIAVAATEDRAYRGVPLELVATVTAARGGTRRLELVLDGAVARERSVELVSGETAQVPFEIVPTASGSIVGEFRLAGADDWASNDRRAFALAVLPPPAVLVVSSASGASRLSGAVVARALAPFAGGQNEMARVRTTVRPLPPPGELAEHDCVVIAAPGELDDADWAACARFVEEGGGLLTFSDEAIATGEALAATRGLLGAASARLREPASPVTLARYDVAHPALASFVDGANGDLALVRFSKLVALAPADDAPRGVAVLATFGGDAAGLPAIIEHRRGRGRAITVATSPVAGWSTLYREPAIVPLVHELVAYLARSDGVLREYVVGQRPSVRLTPVELGSRARLCAGADAGGRVVRELSVDERSLELALGRMGERGLFRLVTASAGRERSRACAVELAPGESSGARVAPMSVAGVGASVSASVDEFARGLAGDDGGVDISRFVAWCALAALAGELVVSALLTRRRSAAPGQVANARGAI